MQKNLVVHPPSPIEVPTIRKGYILKIVYVKYLFFSKPCFQRHFVFIDKYIGKIGRENDIRNLNVCYIAGHN